MPAALIESIRVGREPADMSDDDAIVYSFCTELQRTQSIGDATFERAREQGLYFNALGPRRIRLVTHLDVDRAACERAVELLARLKG